MLSLHSSPPALQSSAVVSLKPLAVASLQPPHLNLRDCRPSHSSVPDPEPRDPLLAEGSVEDAVLPELLAETNGATEHTTEGYVLAEGYLRRGEGGGEGRGGKVKVVSDECGARSEATS